MNDNNSQPTRIKVIGVGGGGNNAVNRMIEGGLDDVEYWSIHDTFKKPNTNPLKKVLKVGKDVGTGSDPAAGKLAAEESIEEIRQIFANTDMVFVAAGLGSGFGTGAAPVVAKAAKDAGVLTIGVVTKPFRFEGPVTMKYAEDGILEMKKSVDALIVIENDNLMKVVEQNTSIKDAFGLGTEVLYKAIQGISTLITKTGYINSDFANVQTVLKDAGTAYIGIGTGSGVDRAKVAAQKALESPLLSGKFAGAKRVLLNIAGNSKLSLVEVQEAAEMVQNMADADVNIIFGTIIDETLNDEVVVTVVSAGDASTINTIPDKKFAQATQTFSKMLDDEDVDDLMPAFLMGSR